MLQMAIPSLERLMLFIIMQISWKDKNIKFIVEKNLEGHRKRNQQTSIVLLRIPLDAKMMKENNN